MPWCLSDRFKCSHCAKRPLPLAWSYYVQHMAVFVYESHSFRFDKCRNWKGVARIHRAQTCSSEPPPPPPASSTSWGKCFITFLAFKFAAKFFLKCDLFLMLWHLPFEPIFTIWPQKLKITEPWPLGCHKEHHSGLKGELEPSTLEKYLQVVAGVLFKCLFLFLYEHEQRWREIKVDQEATRVLKWLCWPQSFFKTLFLKLRNG